MWPTSANNLPTFCQLGLESRLAGQLRGKFWTPCGPLCSSLRSSGVTFLSSCSQWLRGRAASGCDVGSRDGMRCGLRFRRQGSAMPKNTEDESNWRKARSVWGGWVGCSRNGIGTVHRRARPRSSPTALAHAPSARARACACTGVVNASGVISFAGPVAKPPPRLLGLVFPSPLLPQHTEYVPCSLGARRVSARDDEAGHRMWGAVGALKRQLAFAAVASRPLGR